MAHLPWPSCSAASLFKSAVTSSPSSLSLSPPLPPNSGFSKNLADPYSNFAWNLNVLPGMPHSVLKHVEGISGMEGGGGRRVASRVCAENRRALTLALIVQASPCHGCTSA